MDTIDRVASKYACNRQFKFFSIIYVIALMRLNGQFKRINYEKLSDAKTQQL